MQRLHFDGKSCGGSHWHHEAAARGLAADLGGMGQLRFAEFIWVRNTAREAVKRVTCRVQRARAAVWVGGVLPHLVRSQKARAEWAAHSHARAERYRHG